VTTSTDPRGWITRYDYDSRGDRTAVITPSGAVIRFRYDSARQLTEMIDPNGSVTGYGYDNAGQLVMITDAKGGVTRYGYDAAGHLTTSTDQLGQTTTRAYDASGNLISITDPSGHVQHMTYDADGRLTSKTAENAAEVTFSYDAAGRRTAMTDATGTTRYAYDAAGRLMTVTEPDGSVLSAGYDAAGQRTSLTYPDGLQVSYAYDQNGRLTSLNDSRVGQAVYALDADGRLLTEQLPGRLARRYHYDGGLLHRFLAIRDGHPIANTTFDHDPDGRILAQHDLEQSREFRYDPVGQLTAVAEGDREQLLFVYDAVGNRTSKRFGGAETHYRYNAAGQLEVSATGERQLTYRYDTSGRLTEEIDGERRRTITYDGFGLPAAVTRTDPGIHEQALAIFNGDGLLVSLDLTVQHDRPERRDQEHIGAEESASVRYRWSSDQIPQILTQAASPRVDDAEHDQPGPLAADFAYGYGRTFASWEHGTAVFHQDAFGSALRTEDTQPWAQAAAYQVFGAPDLAARGGYGDPHWPELPRFGYRGELALRETIYLRARSYDTTLGRFTTRDPVTPPPGSLQLANPYAYAGNDPLNLTDPTGQMLLQVEPPLPTASGTAVSSPSPVAGVTEQQLIARLATEVYKGILDVPTAQWGVWSVRYGFQTGIDPAIILAVALTEMSGRATKYGYGANEAQNQIAVLAWQLGLWPSPAGPSIGITNMKPGPFNVVQTLFPAQFKGTQWANLVGNPQLDLKATAYYLKYIQSQVVPSAPLSARYNAAEIDYGIYNGGLAAFNNENKVGRFEPAVSQNLLTFNSFFEYTVALLYGSFSDPWPYRFGLPVPPWPPQNPRPTPEPGPPPPGFPGSQASANQ
jgi:RHS repeat-associated protein